MLTSNNRLGRFLAISGATLGVIIAIAWPLHRHASNSILSTLNPPPITSPDSARAEVNFPIEIPKSAPFGYRLIGARVFQIQSLDTPSDLAKVQGNRRRFTGYGIEIFPPREQGQPFRVRAARGSPAEIGGLPSDHAVILVAVNGKRLSDGLNAVPHLPNIHRLPPPLHLTFDDSGSVRVALIKSTGVFFVGGEAPDIPHDKRAALLYSSPNGSLAIVEAQAKPDFQSTFATGSWSDVVNGIHVTYYGSRNTPDASFVHGKIYYEIANDKGSMSQAQIEQLIQGL